MITDDREQRMLSSLNERLDQDFPFYARHHLKIRAESGEIVPLILNSPQEKLHARVEHQKMVTGKVRMLVLKARQQGFSTYVGGRYYHHTTRFSGKATFILSHQAETTEKLFQIIERFHKNCPDAARMPTDVANRRRMVFSDLGSEYFVGTAGNEDVGRGGTVQYLHASEAAFYPDGDGFSRGLLQSVPDLPGTEVIIESTANGMDALFYTLCMQAQAGIGDYELFFSPWFDKAACRRAPPPDFVPTVDEEKLARVYALDWSQIYWRRCKISDLKGDLKSFMQEYPANVEEAFISSGSSLISSFAFMAARKCAVEDTGAPLVIGVDTNEAQGRARTGVCFRRGRVIEQAYAIENKKPMELVAILADLIDHNNPTKMFMDIGNGYAVIDRLIELNYGDVVMPVDFNDGATEETVYLNKRAEMWGAFAAWINDNQGAVRVPDSDVFHKEATAVPEMEKTSSGLKKLKPKAEIEKEAKTRLDIGDAAALTWAYPVRRDTEGTRRKRTSIGHNTPSKIKSIQRRNGFQKETAGVASTTMGWVK
jgi:hypothetical protein